MHYSVGYAPGEQTTGSYLRRSCKRNSLPGEQHGEQHRKPLTPNDDKMDFERDDMAIRNLS
jgi:hypothetical protein